MFGLRIEAHTRGGGYRVLMARSRPPYVILVQRPRSLALVTLLGWWRAQCG